MGEHDCACCGQDLRLGPTAYEDLAALEAEVKRLRALTQHWRTHGRHIGGCDDCLEIATGERKGASK